MMDGGRKLHRKSHFSVDQVTKRLNIHGRQIQLPVNQVYTKQLHIVIN